MIGVEKLIAKFQFALDNHWGYIWGKTCELWTEEKQRAYERDYSGDADRENSCRYGGQWIGHYVTDCSGLFSWSFKQLGGYMYHGSNTMFNSYCVNKGNLNKGKRTDGLTLKPGTAVFTYNSSNGKRGHVGLYIGNGKVIEAAGAKQGVITSAVSNSKWVNWGELKGVDYEGGVQPMPTPEAGAAIVTGNKVALRDGPSTSARVLDRVDTGKSVQIEAIPSEWEYVSYAGKKGFMMSKFLEKG